MLLPSITAVGSVRTGFLAHGNTFPVAALLKAEPLTALIRVTGHTLGRDVTAPQTLHMV